MPSNLSRFRWFSLSLCAIGLLSALWDIRFAHPGGLRGGLFVIVLLGLAATALIVVFATTPGAGGVLWGLAALQLVACSAVVVSVLAQAFVDPTPQWLGSIGSLQTTNLAAGFSVLFIVASMCVVFARASYIRLKGAGTLVPGFVRALFLFFRRFHTLLGWMVVAMVAGHAAYFLIYPEDAPIERTGIIALLVLVLLVAAGFFANYRRRLVLALHTGLSLTFLVALVVHVRVLGIATFFLLLLFALLCVAVIGGYALLARMGRVAVSSVRR